MQFSLAMERQMTRRTTAAISYQGARGVSLYRSRDAYSPMPPDYVRPDPSVATVRTIESAGRMASDGLETTLRGEIAGFDGQASYTLSWSQNNTRGIGWMPPNSLDFSREWGRADFDQRHRLRLIGSTRTWQR